MKKYGSIKVNTKQGGKSDPVLTDSGETTEKKSVSGVGSITGGRSLEVLSDGEKNKVVEHLAAMLDRAPIQEDKRLQIKKDFIDQVMTKGIKEGILHLKEVIKDAKNKPIEKAPGKLPKFKGKQEPMIEKGRENFADLKGTGYPDDDMEDDFFFKMD